jgi:chorismate mutase
VAVLFGADCGVRRAQPEQYSALIRAQDADGLMELLTDVRVEQLVVERVQLKAATFGQEINPSAAAAAAAAPPPQQHQEQQQQQQGESAPTAPPPSYKIAPDVLGRMYDDIIMPLTKKVQVAYLLRRLDHEPSSAAAAAATTTPAEQQV